MTVVTIYQFQYAEVYSSVFDWSEAYYNNQDLNRSGSSMNVVSPLNSLLSTSNDCLQNRITNLYYSGIQLYLSKEVFGIYLENVTLQNLYAIDTPLLKIQSYDVLVHNTTIVQSTSKEVLFYDPVMNI